MIVYVSQHDSWSDHLFLMCLKQYTKTLTPHQSRLVLYCNLQ
jgi:hypothetical protein